MSVRVRGGGNHAAAVPERIAAYFGIGTAPSRDEHPTVERVLYPDRGWVPVAGHKQVSGQFLRTERKNGAMAVAVRLGDRLADFEMKGLVK